MIGKVCCLSSKTNKELAVFVLTSNGISTNRDEWVYDFDNSNLVAKSKYLISEYNSERVRWNEYKKQHGYIDIKDEANPVVDNFLQARNFIKWSKMIKRDKLRKNKPGNFTEEKIISSVYRFFVKKFLYNDYIPIDIKGQQDEIFVRKNIAITVNGANNVSWESFSVNTYTDLNLHKGGAKLFPLYRYDQAGNRVENITDWGLEQFRTHYQDQKISKKAIFHYTYAVLHNPAYRQKYELNLKREFPRLPFYPDFGQWVAWGKALMELHINYETAKKYPLKRQDLTGLKNLSGLKVKLKADKLAGMIEIDEQTTLHGIPEAAWEYKLGNRSTLEWILDQYKEKKPSDPTIAEKFNTYRFADYKEAVIELLQRVCTVSVRTVEIIKQMEKQQENVGK